MTPVRGNLFASAEAGGGGAQVLLVVSNSGLFLTEELENWEAVLLLLLTLCPSAREAPLADRVFPQCHMFNLL